MNISLWANGGLRTDFKSPKTGNTLGFRQSLILLLMLSFFGNAWGQTSIFSESMGTTATNPQTIASYTGFQNSGTLTFSGSAVLRTSSNSTGYAGASGSINVAFANTDLDFIVSGINASAYSNVALSFGLKAGAASATNSHFKISYSTTGPTGTFTDLPVTINGGTTWTLYTTGVIPSNVNAIRFYRNSVGTAGWDFRLDDVKLSGTIISPCSGTPTPGNTLAATNPVVGGGTTVLSLQNTTSGSGITYQWQSSTTDSNSGFTNISGATNATYTATPGALKTWYKCVVTCSGNSGASTPVEVNLTYCTPSSSGSSTYINSFSTSGGSSANITNNSSGFASGGYQDNYSSMLVNASPNTSFNYSFTLAGGTAGVAIWVDWNKNLIFETSERVYNSNSFLSNGNYPGSITVPAGTATGDYRLRIRTDFNLSNPDPCTSTSRAEAEDYKLTIVTASETPLLSVSGTTAHGTICPGTVATSQTYTITNTGTSDATGVTVLSDNAEFVVSGLSSTTIAGSGGTATYVVTFTPNSAGAKTAAITVASTTSGSNTATSSLNGTGAIAVLPSVSTSAATLVTTTTATLNASGSTFGICPNTTAKGFVISQTGLNADPLFGGTGVIDEKVSSLGTQGAFAKAITGLLSGTMYSYKSYLFDGSTYTYGAVQTFTTQAAPANDLCSNAQVLTINGPVVNGTFINSSFETPFTSGKDVWYKFTPSCDGKFTIDLVATAGQPQIYLYSVCGTSTSIQNTIGTGTTKQLTTGSLSSGIDYFIRIMAGNSAAESATFTIAVNNQISVVTQPVNQTVTSGGTATFSSSAPNNQTDRQWQVSTDGGLSFTNISGATATSYTTSATTLSMNGYQYRVVISNGTCNTVISSAATLTVNSCTPSSTNTSDYISNFTTSGGMVNISKLASGYSAGGYGNFYATHYVSQYAGGAINFVENYVGGNHGFKIWVDWNKDGDFAVSEEVYTPSVSATEFNGSFTIPEGTALGDYRMRIRAVYQATGLPTMNPCGTVTYGEGEDYKLTVAPTPNYVVYTDAASASATVNNTINVYLKDFDGINEFYTYDETSIYMYAWGYASNQNIYDTGTLVRFDRESTNPNVYKASVKFADLFCIPTGTNVGGIDLLFRNQYGTGGNNQTGNLYLDLTDAAVAVNAPTLGTVTGITSSSATISWNAPATGSVKGFDYYYSTSSTAPNAGTAATGSTAANVNGATLSSLSSGTTYYYWVRSKGCDTPSGWSSEGVFSTLCLDAPVAHAVATDDITATTFLASWDAVPGASSYILEVSTSPTFGIYGTTTVAENFDGSSTPSLPSSNSPATAYTFGSGAWTIANGTKSPQSVHTPANTIQLSNNPNNSYLISPGVDNLTTVSFYARRNGTSNSVTAGINVYKVVGTTETLLKFINLPNDGNNNSNFIQYSVNVNGQNTNNVKIKITQTENASHLDTFVLTSEINNPDFVAPYQKLNVGDVTSYLVDLNLLPNTQYYYRVRAINASLCESPNSNVVPVLTKNDAVVWYSAKWSNVSGPTENLNSIIRDVYHAGNPGRPSFETKNLKVESNGLLTIGKDQHVTVHGLINTVDDKIIVEDDGMLHQIGQGDNTGKITVERNVTFTTARQQYNYMISPVKDQKMKYIFGADGSGVPYIQYVMRLNEPTNIFVNDGDGIYAQGKGYAVKEAKTSYASNDGVAIFKGVPANGDFEYPLSNTPNRGYNLSGNPYPSNLDLTKLYEDSKNSEGGHYISSTIRFWDNKSNDVIGQQGGSYQGYAYAVFNASSGVGTKAPGSATITSSGKKPNQYVKVGQGFLVKAVSNSPKLIFRNSQRDTAAAESGFFGKEAAKDRYWLELKTPSDFTISNAIVYFDAGTNSFAEDDTRIPNSAASDALFSYAGDAKVVINGRNTFANQDVISLGLRHFVAGSYTISVHDAGGRFATGQSIYLKDKLLGILTDLTAGDYTFTSEAGEFTNRFEIVYKPATTLGTAHAAGSGIEIYREGSSFVIRSSGEKITNAELYDAAGRLLLRMGANTREVRFEADRLADGMYVVKTLMSNGESLSKKIRK